MKVFPRDKLNVLEKLKEINGNPEMRLFLNEVRNKNKGDNLCGLPWKYYHREIVLIALQKLKKKKKVKGFY